ncbi:MAG: thymidine phosphorylase [Candidatus Eremiobacteraeota bacterium]|nr:thymidine phosphorylase [Candidatus Eremiobacteraeota bacterium]
MDEMTMRRAIEQKRAGAPLTDEQWVDVVTGFMQHEIDDAQMAALLMACVWRGMSVDETYALTDAMVRSGERLQFDRGDIVDKHSTGGVSDIVSLVAVPLAAACGAHVAKLSGRALGHTGGTIDKLEMIPGFNVNLSPQAFIAQVERIGCAIAAQTDALAPADKHLYKLRDHTGTVPSMGLIAASIASKKVAGGANAFVFDVKSGRAAFMQDPHDAEKLAALLVELSARFNRRATAFVTDMNEPLGRAIGPYPELLEARNFLKQPHPMLRQAQHDKSPTQHDKSPTCHPELVEGRVLTVVLAMVEAMLEAVGVSDGKERAREALASGAAYDKFLEMIEAQGGTRATFETMQLCDARETVRAGKSGFIESIDVVRLGNVARELSGRDPHGGIVVAAAIGERIQANTPLAHIYGSDASPAAMLAGAFTIGNDAPGATPLIR